MAEKKLCAALPKWEPPPPSRKIRIRPLRYRFLPLARAMSHHVPIFTPPGGVMTFHDYGYLAARIFKELPCFGVKFSNIHPALESEFLPGIFSGRIYCYANFFCYANFSVVFKPILFGGKGKLLEGKPAVSRTMYQNTKMSCFQRKPLTNSCTVCHIRTLNMLKTSKLGLISWTKDK